MFNYTEIYNNIYNEVTKSISGDFSRGMIVASAIAAITYGSRQLLYKSLYWLDRLTSVTLIVNTANRLEFETIAFIERKFAKENDYTQSVTYGYQNLGYGKFYRWYKGRPLIITKKKVESQHQHYDEIVLKTWLNKKITKQLLEEQKSKIVKTIGISTKNTMTLYPVKEDIFLPTKNVQNLCKQFVKIKNFWDKDINIKTSFLLYGKPGQGKSQAIKNICIKLGIPLKIICLDNSLTNSQIIEEIMGYNKIVLLLEDIDRYDVFCNHTNTQANTEYNKSAILNMIDGVTSPDSIIVVGTTNHLEKLDPAILRSGRFDCHVEFINPNKSEIEDLWYNSFEEKCPSEILEELDGKPLCDVYKKIKENFLND